MMPEEMTARYGSGDDCPLCHGTGWETYEALVEGYSPHPVTFAVRCCRCSGVRISQDRTGAPPDYRNADIRKFDFAAYSRDMSKVQKMCMNLIREFGRWSGDGKGLYLWSKTPGSGKTFLACCIAKTVMVTHSVQMRFITAPDYVSRVGDSYKRDRGEEDPSEIYRTCPLLVLDDIGAQADREWQQQEMFRIINHRMENGCVTIYTSNKSPADLNVDDRTKDRIIKSSVVIQMPEESIRRKKAKQEQDDFLKKIMGE